MYSSHNAVWVTTCNASYSTTASMVVVLEVSVFGPMCARVASLRAPKLRDTPVSDEVPVAVNEETLGSRRLLYDCSATGKHEMHRLFMISHTAGHCSYGHFPVLCFTCRVEMRVDTICYLVKQNVACLQGTCPQLECRAVWLVINRLCCIPRVDVAEHPYNHRRVFQRRFFVDGYRY